MANVLSMIKSIRCVSKSWYWEYIYRWSDITNSPLKSAPTTLQPSLSIISHRLPVCCFFVVIVLTAWFYVYLRLPYRHQKCLPGWGQLLVLLFSLASCETAFEYLIRKYILWSVMPVHVHEAMRPREWTRVIWPYASFGHTPRWPTRTFSPPHPSAQTRHKWEIDELSRKQVCNSK